MDCLWRKALRDDLDLQNLVAVAAARAIELSNKQVVLIEENNQKDLYCLQKSDRYNNKYNKDKSN